MSIRQHTLILLLIYRRRPQHELRVHASAHHRHDTAQGHQQSGGHDLVSDMTVSEIETIETEIVTATDIEEAAHEIGKDTDHQRGEITGLFIRHMFFQ